MFRKLMIIFAVATLVVAGAAQANPVAGPGSINWMGFDWTVDANATAYVNPTTGWLEIAAGGDTGDDGADNWNVWVDVMQELGPPEGQPVFCEISFLDAGTNFLGEYGGGPRVRFAAEEQLDIPTAPSTSRLTDIMGGMYAADPEYAVDYEVTILGSGTVVDDTYAMGSRTRGEHTLRFEWMPEQWMRVYFDGALAFEELDPEDVPAMFNEIYLGVTSSYPMPGAPGYGIYTSFSCGDIPEPGTVMLSAAGLIGLVGARLRRRK